MRMSWVWMLSGQMGGLGVVVIVEGQRGRWGGVLSSISPPDL